MVFYNMNKCSKTNLIKVEKFLLKQGFKENKNDDTSEINKDTESALNDLEELCNNFKVNENYFKKNKDKKEWIHKNLFKEHNIIEYWAIYNPSEEYPLRLLPDIDSATRHYDFLTHEKNEIILNLIKELYKITKFTKIINVAGKAYDLEDFK